MFEKVTEICKSMFWGYSLQNEIEVELEDEYEEGVFTVSLKYGEHEINNVVVNFNKKTVYIAGEYTNYPLVDFDDLLFFERGSSFFETLFIQLIYN